MKKLNEKVDIIAVKHPSMIKDVDYKTIVDDLWKTHISDNDAEDRSSKKMIANVNIGLLEKGTNKAHKGFMFTDINECKHYQEKYGGTNHRIQQEDEIEFVLNPEELSSGSHLDFGLDVPMTMVQTKTEKKKKNK